MCTSETSAISTGIGRGGREGNDKTQNNKSHKKSYPKLLFLFLNPTAGL